MPVGVYTHKKLSDEHRKNIGLGMLGRVVSKKTRKLIGLKNSIANKGKHNSPRTEFKKGDKLPDKTRKNIKNGHLKIGKKISDTMKRLWANPDYRKKMIEKKKGNKCAIGPHPSMQGSNHFNWKDGSSYKPYSTDWNKTLKRSIRERDNYICQSCSQYGNVVHHIDYDKKNCNPDNLITLCSRCHCKTNFNRPYWTSYFNLIINNKKI